MDEGILAAISKPVAVLSPRLDVRFANAAFRDLVGDRGDDLERLGERVRANQSLFSILTRALSKLRVIGWTTDVRWSVTGSESRNFDVHVTRANPDDYVAILDDVSQYVRIEEIQTRARSYLEAVLNHLRLGVIVLDARFNATFFNSDQAALFKRLGVERSIFDIIGAPIAESYPVFEAGEWEGIYSRVVRGGENITWSRVPYPRTAPTSYFMVHVVPLLPEADRLPGAICITDDVTRTVALERELLMKDRMALVGQMSIALNHEINNPLTAILGTAETLVVAGGLPVRQLERLDTIRENAERIAEVTRRLQALEEVHLTEYVEGGPLMLDLHIEQPAAERP